MTEPPVNRSVKAFNKIKGNPASAAGRSVDYFDWGAHQKAPNASAVGGRNALFKTKDDILSPLKQMGINPQYMISLPCCQVNDMPNKRIYIGDGTLFNGQLARAKPFTGLSKIAFEKSQRVGKFGIDLSQKPFTFSSFSSSMCS